MAGYQGSQDKLVNSDYLYKNLQAMDLRRAKKLHDSLFIDHETVIEHYALADVQDGSKGLIIVDTVVSNPDTEVLLSDVQAKLLPDDVHSYQLGDKVDLIPEQEIYLKSSTLSHETEDLDLDTLDQIVP